MLVRDPVRLSGAGDSMLNMPKGWGLPKDPRIRHKMDVAMRMGGGLQRRSRMRKKREKGEYLWFDLHVKGGGFLP